MKKPNIQVAFDGVDGKVRFYKAVKIEGYEQGYALTYKDKDKKEQTCEFLREYRLHEINGIPTVGQCEGSVCAVEMFGDKVLDSPGENYALLLRTHLYSEGHKTLVGGMDIPWKWVLIGIVIIAVVLIGWKVIGGMGKEAPPAQSPAAIEQQMQKEAGGGGK